MIHNVFTHLAAFVLFALTPLYSAEFTDELAGVADPIFNKYCLDCHGTKKQKGNIRLDTLSRNLSDTKTAIAWRDILDVLRAGEMPPEEKPRPTAPEMSKLIEIIDKQLSQITSASAGRPRYAIRRLSHTALDNTVRDLLGVEISLSHDLPHDTEVSGFDNQAQTMSLSPEMLSQLQLNAKRIAQFALVDGPDPRSSATFTGNTIVTNSTATALIDSVAATFSNRGIAGQLWPHDFKAPRPGYYDISISAHTYDNREELFKKHPKYIFVNADKATRSIKLPKLAANVPREGLILASSFAAVGNKKPTPLPSARIVGRFDLGLKKSESVVRCLLNEGENISLLYVNAPSLVSPAVPIIKDGDMKSPVGEAMYVHKIGITGPILSQWPPPLSTALVGDGKKKVSESEIPSRLRTSLTQIFRRPVSDSTVKLYHDLYAQEHKTGKNQLEALRSVLEAVLCSPRFIFTYDALQDESYDIATRLSYFLWNSTPDQTLLDLASSQKLNTKEVLAAQVKRMLADARSQAFVSDFVSQWLETKKIGRMIPDPKLYPTYDSKLEDSLRQEPVAFFSEILTSNLSARQFIDSDFLMLNQRLAEHYGVKDVKGDHFRKVPNTKPEQRGGIMGQASMLLVTSNGTRTSPVVRGVWMLENVFGSPPSPPPPNIEPLDPDVRGATTIREMLAKHRQIETCNDCHRKIDPLGFAMENFNAIGSWRDHYALKGKSGEAKDNIDVSGQLPNGTKVDGFLGLKKALLNKPETFVHALSDKLMMYAMGRPLGVSERSEIDRVVAQAKANDYRIVDLISALCTTDIFVKGGK
jgi:hypothetical protein